MHELTKFSTTARAHSISHVLFGEASHFDCMSPLKCPQTSAPRSGRVALPAEGVGRLGPRPGHVDPPVRFEADPVKTSTPAREGGPAHFAEGTLAASGKSEKECLSPQTNLPLYFSRPYCGWTKSCNT